MTHDLGDVVGEEEAIVELDVGLDAADDGDERVVGGAVQLTSQLQQHSLAAHVLVLRAVTRADDTHSAHKSTHV